MNRSPKTILVVDDDTALLQALRTRLMHANFDVLTATNAADALHLARDTTVDAITLDVGLSGSMDGLGVAAELHADKHTAGIPIVFITGTTDPEFKQKCHSVGGEYFLAKPYDVDVLIHILTGLLAKDELAQAREISNVKRRQPIG